MKLSIIIPTYNTELMVVQEYLSGSLGYRAIAKKYGVGASPLRRWVRAYKEFGCSGLSVKKTKQFYYVQFKLDVLNFIKRTGASHQDTAIHFNLNDPTLVASWYHRFLKEGIEGLQRKSKGRPSMSNKQKSTVNNQEKTMYCTNCGTQNEDNSKFCQRTMITISINGISIGMIIPLK